MKILFNYCEQQRKYASSYGLCLVQLEPGDNADEIIKEFTKPREWYELKFSGAQRISEYVYEKYNTEKKCKDKATIVGDLILFKTFQEYLD